MDEIIKQVAEQLQLSVEYVFDVFVNAQSVIGILHFVSVIFAIIVLFGYFKLVSPKIKEKFDLFEDNNSLFLFIGMMILVILFLCYLVFMNEVILKIILPEYTAIKELIRIIK